MKKSSRRPLEDYQKLKYPVFIREAQEGGFVAEIPELPGCITQGETIEEIYRNIEDAKRAWIEVAYEEGEEVPLPKDKQEYSGKFVVRIPKSLHRRLAEQARAEKTSLNQYVAVLLATKSGAKGH